MSNYYHCSNYTVILLAVPYTISIQLFRVAMFCETRSFRGSKWSSNSQRKLVNL